MGRSILGLGGSDNGTGVVGSPFFDYLTDDGSDVSLNENYSGGAVDAYWQAPANAIIPMMVISGGLEDIASSTAITSAFLGITALTNGLKFAVKNGSTVVQDYTVTSPLKTTTDLSCFCSNFNSFSELSSGTSANNEMFLSFIVNFETKFGGLLYVPEGYRFVCTLQDNLSSLSTFQIGISGYYVY